MNKIKNIMLTIVTAISIIFLIGMISYYTEAENSPIINNNYDTKLSKQGLKEL